MFRRLLAAYLCGLLLIGFSLPTYGSMLPAQFEGAPLLADWDFGGGTPLVDNVAGRTMNIVEDNPGDILLDSITDNNGVTKDVLRFTSGQADDYATVSHDAADLLESGILRLVGLNTGAFNIGDEAIVSKDHFGTGTGGHLTVKFKRIDGLTGHVEVRLQAIGSVGFVLTSSPINLNEFIDVVIPFGLAYGGLQLFVDRDLSDGDMPVMEDSTPFFGGIEANIEPWVFGSSLASHDPPASQGGIDETKLVEGLSGSIAGFQIYGVPEPTAAVLFACGLGIVGGFRRRRAR